MSKNTIEVQRKLESELAHSKTVLDVLINDWQEAICRWSVGCDSSTWEKVHKESQEGRWGTQEEPLTGT